MPAKQGKKGPSPAMGFLVDSLKKNRKASYGDLKAKADEKNLKVFPIMFGRAQALLGIVKSSPRGKGRRARANAAKAAGSAPSARRGRPANASSKSGQVRELLKTGMSVADIAKKVGCTPGLVYNVKSTSGRSAKPGPGRPRKALGIPSMDGIAGIVEVVRSGERQRAQLRTALERIQSVVADALG